MRMLLVCLSYVLVCHPNVTRMYSYVIRMSLVCTRMSYVCQEYVLICHPYVTRIYSYVIRTSLVCTPMSYVCQQYVLICHYELSTLAAMQCSIDRYLRESNYEYSVLNSRLFKGSRDVLERKARLAHEKGLGKKPNKKNSLTRQ